MTTLQIISRLLSIIYDLLLLAKGKEVRNLEDIEKEIEKVQLFIEPYAQEQEGDF